MRYFITLVPLFIILACSENTTSNNSNSEDISNHKNFDWLIGEWQRTNDQEGRKTYESWAKKSSTEYIGLGYTLQEADTVFKEDIRLIPVNDIWNFEVTGEDGKPVLFAVTAQTDHSFVCQNLENEFPKKIEYALIDGKIEAGISGGGPDISFSFEPLK